MSLNIRRPHIGHRPFRRQSLGLVCLAVLALAGCGRRGPLELPPGTPPQAATSPSTLAGQNRVLNDQDTPGLIQSPDTVIERSPDEKLQQIFHEGKVAPPINAPPGSAEPQKKPFILDPLL